MKGESSANPASDAAENQENIGGASADEVGAEANQGDAAAAEAVEGSPPSPNLRIRMDYYCCIIDVRRKDPNFTIKHLRRNGIPNVTELNNQVNEQVNAFCPGATLRFMDVNEEQLDPDEMEWAEFLRRLSHINLIDSLAPISESSDSSSSSDWY